MAVRLKEGMIPYTGGDGIEITDNHVINVLLRAANNLIQVNDDREIYVDLQLPAGIAPDDVFPVGITTGEILAEDGWQQSGTIINSKTTSGDYVRLIYANDGNLYYDPGTGQWIMIGTATAIDVNTKTFFITGTTGDANINTVKSAIAYYEEGKNPILFYRDESDSTKYGAYLLKGVGHNIEVQGDASYLFTRIGQRHGSNGWVGDDNLSVYKAGNYVEVVRTVEGKIYTIAGELGSAVNQDIFGVKTFYSAPVVPSKSTPAGNNPTSIATEAQVYLKQDKLTAGSGIVIDSNTNTISANIQGALVYKGNVATTSDLPASGTVGDVYYVEADGLMYAWDGTQWKAVGNTQIDLSNYFNVTTNTTDDITEGSTNLFVTQAMIDAWDGKQGALTAGTNITINNGTISATDTTYTAGTGITIDQNNEISNSLPFNPENAGTVGQVLKRTSTGVRWSNEMSVKGASFSAFLNMCTTNGSKHTSTIRKYSTYGSQDVGEASYTMQGYGWFNYSIYVGGQTGSTAKIKINGIELDAVYSPQSTEGITSEARFITVGPEDVITVSLDKYAGEAKAEIIDYY